MAKIETPSAEVGVQARRLDAGVMDIDEEHEIGSLSVIGSHLQWALRIVMRHSKGPCQRD